MRVLALAHPQALGRPTWQLPVDQFETEVPGWLNLGLELIGVLRQAGGSGGSGQVYVGQGG